MFDFASASVWWGQRFLPLVRYCRCAFYHRCFSQTADANNIFDKIFLVRSKFILDPNIYPQEITHIRFIDSETLTNYMLIICFEGECGVWPWTTSEHICRRLNLKWTLRPTFKWRLLELVCNLNYYKIKVNYQIFPHFKTVHHNILEMNLFMQLWVSSCCQSKPWLMIKGRQN